MNVTASTNTVLCTDLDRVSRGRRFIGLDFDGVLHAPEAGPPLVWTEAVGRNQMSAQDFNAHAVADALARQNAAPSSASSGGSMFDRGIHLIDVLQRHEDVQIVIATSWRNALTVDQIMTLMPPMLASRVVGMLERYTSEHSSWGIRCRLMKAWMDRFAAPGSLWLALDDQPQLWEGHGDRLIRTPFETGMGPKEARLLDEHLNVIARSLAGSSQLQVTPANEVLDLECEV